LPNAGPRRFTDLVCARRNASALAQRLAMRVWYSAHFLLDSHEHLTRGIQWLESVLQNAAFGAYVSHDRYFLETRKRMVNSISLTEWRRRVKGNTAHS